ncbi:MAG: serine/threonine protein kinase [Pseudomonadota bacterium]
MTSSISFGDLRPDQFLGAVDSLGLRCDGRFLSLNSYENRVYQINLEDNEPIVAKFYRPNRWSDEAILEEHQFAEELQSAEIPVVAPFQIASKTLHNSHGFRFALYPRKGGRTPELDNLDLLQQIGRLVARIHKIGQIQPFQHRPAITLDTFGIEAATRLLKSNLLPIELSSVYEQTCEHVLAGIDQTLETIPYQTLRTHGDLHPSNVLVRGEQIHIVDLDDTRTAPAIQDLWMFLSGQRSEQTPQMEKLLEGYHEFHSLDMRELHLIEALRSLRIIHYAAWLGDRWQEPAFQRAFPWFNSQKYWEEHVLSLKEQIALMQEDPLLT